MKASFGRFALAVPMLLGSTVSVGCGGGEGPSSTTSGPAMGAGGEQTSVGGGGSSQATDGATASSADGASSSSSCEQLTAQEARTIVVDRFLALQNAVLDAWPAVENSVVLPRVLGLGKSQRFGKSQDARDDVENERKDWNERVFADANVETAQGAAVVFRLKPATYCAKILDDCIARSSPTLPISVGSSQGTAGTHEAQRDGGAGSEGGAGDAHGATCTDPYVLDDYDDCSKDLTEHEIRLETRRIGCESGTNVRVSVLAGQDRLVPGTIDLYPDHAVATIDFSAIAEIASSFTDPSDHVVVESGATGKIQTELQFGTRGQASFRMNVPEAVKFSWTSNGKPSGIAMAAGQRVLEVTLDANRHTATAHLAFGQLRVTTWLDSVVRGWFDADVIDAAHEKDPADFVLSGLTGDFAYDGANDALHATDLGLGSSASKLVHGGATLLTIDVDAEGDRKVNADFLVSDNGQVQVTLRPDFGLTLGYAMSEVSPYCRGLPDFTLDDTLTIHFTDPAAASAKFILDSNGDTALPGSQIGALLAIVTGQLTMTSRFAPTESVSVSAGQCLYRDANRKNGSHAVLRALFAAACP